MKKEDNALTRTEDIFAQKGIEVVRRGMMLILDRLRFAKKYDAKVREAICMIDEDDELKAAQTKMLIDVLKRAGVMDTSEVLTLVTAVIERLGGGNRTPPENEGGEVLVTLDERVEQWAK